MKNILHQPYLKKIAVLLLIAGVSLSCIQIFAQTSFEYDSFSFNIRTELNWNGGTSIVIPPVGQLFFKSHLTPWQLIITLNEINFTSLEQQLESLPPKQQWLEVLQVEAMNAILTLFSLVFLFGVSAGLLTLLILRIHPLNRMFWYGLSTSILVVLTLIGTTVFSFNRDAVKHPQYQGVLESAPWAMDLVTMSLDNLEVIGSSLRKISEGMPRLYQQAAQMKNLGELQPDLTILHVSDIHNNPAAFDLINQLSSNFEVDFIIDTGDLTDYGTALEARITEEIAKLNLPYVFIPGNHESPLIIDRLRQLKNVKIISDGVLKIQGLTILGLADPASVRFNPDVDNELEKVGQYLTDKVMAQATPPDILAVHNLKIATDLIGQLPVILCGHTHSYQLKIEKGTIIHNTGTTGAAGARGLTPQGVPYSAALVHWKKAADNRLKLVAIDSIKINGMEGRFTIDRHTF